MVTITLFFLSIMLEIDAEFIQETVERILEAIFVDLLFTMVEALADAATILIGETFLGLWLALILAGTGAMAIRRASQ